MTHNELVALIEAHGFYENEPCWSDWAGCDRRDLAYTIFRVLDEEGKMGICQNYLNPDCYLASFEDAVLESYTDEIGAAMKEFIFE